MLSFELISLYLKRCLSIFSKLTNLIKIFDKNLKSFETKSQGEFMKIYSIEMVNKNLKKVQMKCPIDINVMS